MCIKLYFKEIRYTWCILKPIFVVFNLKECYVWQNDISKMKCFVCLEEPTGDLPESCELRVEQKRFYFDVGRNPRGTFMRISEVQYS